MYVLNEFMEFDVDTPHIATYNFKLVFHLLFLTIYSTQALVKHFLRKFQIRIFPRKNLIAYYSLGRRLIEGHQVH